MPLYRIIEKHDLLRVDYLLASFENTLNYETDPDCYFTPHPVFVYS